MIPFVPAVLAVVLGVSAVGLAHKRAWAHVVVAALLAWGAIYIAVQPLTHPIRPVVNKEQP